MVEPKGGLPVFVHLCLIFFVAWVFQTRTIQCQYERKMVRESPIICGKSVLLGPIQRNNDVRH